GTVHNGFRPRRLHDPGQEGSHAPSFPPHARLDRPRRHRRRVHGGPARSRGRGRRPAARGPGAPGGRPRAVLPARHPDADGPRGQGGQGHRDRGADTGRPAGMGDVRRGRDRRGRVPGRVLRRVRLDRPGGPRRRSRRPDRSRRTAHPVTTGAARTPSSPEQPWPVRVVSDQIAGWIHRLGTVWVEGQITQLSLRPGTRTAFLTLRDPSVDNSLTLTCPPKLVSESPVPVTEGSRVVVRGTPRFYTGRGSFSLQVTEIRPVGVGELLARIERLKQALTAEGLFNLSLQRPLPFLPGRVGLITGRASAAERDVVEVARSRWPDVRFEIRNTAVQGPSAVPQVLDALAELEADPA